MSSWKESSLFCVLKGLAWVLRHLPVRIALFIGKVFGYLWYLCDFKHRWKAYQNIKYAFAGEKFFCEIRAITRRCFLETAQKFVEFLCLPAMTPERVKTYIHIEGLEYVQGILSGGKGAVFMSAHHGNWEMSSLVVRLTGLPCSVIYKVQESRSQFNALLEDYRSKAYALCGGITMYERGMGARELLDALGQNETLGLLVDQGGKDGISVPFFGKTVQMSPGGFRLAIKTGVDVYAGFMHRLSGPHHALTVLPFPIEKTDLGEKHDAERNLQRFAGFLEEAVRQNPEQYMWIYKLWKFDTTKNVLIVDDGRTGHLRQSQAAAGALESELLASQRAMNVRTAAVVYRNFFGREIAALFALVARFLPPSLSAWMLKICLKKDSFADLMSLKADYVMSCGARGGFANVLLTRENAAKAIAILPPRILPHSYFDLVALAKHDFSDPKRLGKNVILTRGAPNLIDDAYLDEHRQRLLSHYSHLKVNEKFRIGVLLGGDTKTYVLDEGCIKVLINQIKEAAQQLDADILLTTSRRTSSKVENFIMRELKKDPRCQLLIIANRQNIPEAVGGILALSDVAVVSGDSISMVSEAASSGKRTVVFPVRKREGTDKKEEHKHNRFVDGLNQDGYVLCSNTKMVGQAIFNLAKNKISLRPLDTLSTLRHGMRSIV